MKNSKDKERKSTFISDANADPDDESQEEDNYLRQLCTACNDELISDVEDEDLKNIGCDNCSNWFHFKCTELNALPYDIAAGKEFHCQFC